MKEILREIKLDVLNSHELKSRHTAIYLEIQLQRHVIVPCERKLNFRKFQSIFHFSNDIHSHEKEP